MNRLLKYALHCITQSTTYTYNDASSIMKHKSASLSGTYKTILNLEKHNIINRSPVLCGFIFVLSNELNSVYIC